VRACRDCSLANAAATTTPAVRDVGGGGGAAGAASAAGGAPPPYYGEIEFISAGEWAKELGALLDDLTQQDGRAILHVHDPDAHNYGAWCKLFAVYGEARRGLAMLDMWRGRRMVAL
jgi:hypothetical protein